MKLGLCLAGGGIKGAAHIGAIKAMEEENIKFDYLAGTSSGSIVATLLACGYSSNEIYSLFKKYAKSIKKTDWGNIFKILIGLIFEGKIVSKGFKNGEIIEKIVDGACSKQKIHNINKVRKKLIIPAVDSKSGKVYIFNSLGIDSETKEEKYISNASIGKVVRASCSYPVIFSPCPYKDRELLDGGIKANIPWKELKNSGCQKVLSINFKNTKDKKCCDNMLDIAERSFELLNQELNRYELDRVDFLHTIELDDVSLLDIKRMQEIYEQGYIQTRDYMSKIKAYLNK